jgi:SAM-dependent methyltransferase
VLGSHPGPAGQKSDFGGARWGCAGGYETEVDLEDARLTARIQADFDRIARLWERDWNHNEHYHGYLLGHVPADCAWALDIGCGTGAFSRLLARRSERVLALDLSPQMIRVAKQGSEGTANVEYEVGDVMTWDFPMDRFDCIASIATLHHLPMRSVLDRMKGALRAGGSLLILDLYRGEGLGDVLASVVAVPCAGGLRLIKSGHLREPAEIREAWAAHGEHDAYLTLSEVRRICDELLPGAMVKRHLLWRYSVVWRKG